MSVKVIDGDGVAKYFKTVGAGTSANPFTSVTTGGFSDSPSIDAFGRLRVSNPETLFDSKQLYDKSPLFFDEETSGGSETSSHSTTNAGTTMSVTANGEYVIRQSKQRMNYQPGKSQQILCTFLLGAATTNVTKRVGYFNSNVVAPFDSDKDGIYLEQDGTTQYVVMSKNGTATSVAQSSWNLDTMDGTGNSGITLDFTKTQILTIDFEWLGVGRVRIGFVIDGLIYYVHEFLNANNLSSVYMSSPNHSIRYEIRSTGGADSLTHICSSVNSEGGQQPSGISRYKSTEGTAVTCSTENVIYAIVGIRLKSTHLDATIAILNEALQIQTASDRIEWMLIFNPTIAGTFTYSDLTNSAIQTATGATANTVTGGTILSGGFAESLAASSGGAGSIISQLENALRLGSNIDGTPDEIVLCARPVGGATAVDVEGALFWRELI